MCIGRWSKYRHYYHDHGIRNHPYISVVTYLEHGHTRRMFVGFGSLHRQCHNVLMIIIYTQYTYTDIYIQDDSPSSLRRNFPFNNEFIEIFKHI